MTPEERDEYRRIAREEARAVAKEETRIAALPLQEGLRKHSGQLIAVREEVSPAVARQIADSDHNIEAKLKEQNAQFQSFVMHALDINGRSNAAILEEQSRQRDEQLAIREAVADVSKSIRPAAIAATGAEAAAVAGAKAMVLVEGKTQAVQLAADRADANSLAAKNWSKLSPVITAVVFGSLMGIAKFIEWIIAHAGITP